MTVTTDKAQVVKYAATLTGVRDVALRGTADLSYWTDRLLAERLVPVDREGYADVTVMAVAGKFRGLAFRELSISVAARTIENGGGAGAFLVHAYNSSRLLALAERTLFSTPYYYARIHLETRPAQFRLVKDGSQQLAARRADEGAGQAPEPATNCENDFVGPIFLPGSPRRPNAGGLFFLARLVGHARTYVHRADRDTFDFEPAKSEPGLRDLVDSGFSPRAWSVREDAVHARSKTFRRRLG